MENANDVRDEYDAEEEDTNLEETNEHTADTEESTEETEGEDGGDTDESDTERDERRERRESQIDRLKKKNDEYKRRLKEFESTKGTGNGKETNSELIERTYLAANGVTDKEAQAEAIRLAHKFDFSIDEALDDADIKRRVDNIVRERKANRSVTASSGGARQSPRTVEYWVKQTQEKGVLAPTEEMRKKVLERLAGK